MFTAQIKRTRSENMTQHTGKFVAYYRVSTDKQGKSGLGLDAQRDRVTTYLNGGNWSLIGEFTEVESGRMNDRPALAQAVKLCKREKATLVVATLDRLTRDLAFGATLLNDNKVKFVCADFPEASREMLQMRMVFAEWEARKIGERTKAALGELKKQGVKLGSPTPEIGSVAGTKRIIEKADAYADRVGPVVRDIIKKSGAQTLRDIAAALEARGVPTPRGGSEWYPSQVSNLLKRID
jgi:DNA invertase Pin-like site-specific DNA recombinase